MSVIANTTRLQARLRNLVRELPTAVSAGLVQAAQETIKVVDGATRSEWSGDSSQIGFDIDSFSASIQGVSVLGGGGYGILDVNKMGTAADFEQIGKGTGLWHEGGRRGDAFRRFILERPGQADALAQLRKAIWGSTNPQWFFLEYGNQQYGGAFPIRRGTATIQTAAFDSEPNVRRVIESTVNARLRSAGVF